MYLFLNTEKAIAAESCLQLYELNYYTSQAVYKRIRSEESSIVLRSPQYAARKNGLEAARSRQKLAEMETSSERGIESFRLQILDGDGIIEWKHTVYEAGPKGKLEIQSSKFIIPGANAVIPFLNLPGVFLIGTKKGKVYLFRKGATKTESDSPATVSGFQRLWDRALDAFNKSDFFYKNRELFPNVNLNQVVSMKVFFEPRWQENVIILLQLDGSLIVIRQNGEYYRYIDSGSN